MNAYLAEIIDLRDGVTTIQLSFGEAAQNDRIVRDASSAIGALRLQGGRGVKLTGPCSIPAALAIGHAVSHLFGFVACYDPKLERYVVCVSHDPATRVGDLIP